ncbi:MAG: glycosyltransferase [Negativicutes bacterium]|nr:glycosyltransferase [Negativicutes bacterium]
MIDLLIPTYNREQDLIANIKHLNDLIVKEKIVEHFRILVSDNCSVDNTWRRLNECALAVELVLFKQNNNIGLERNAVFLLQKSTSEYIMYIGDDDYLPVGYLAFIVRSISLNDRLSVIIPGYQGVFEGGRVEDHRIENFEIRKFSPGIMSSIMLAPFGHQLSGLLLRSESLLDNYLRFEKYRNIYPFIYFVAINAYRGPSIYVPKFKVSVTQTNSKDWKYDESGLLAEIFKNYNILFPCNPLIRAVYAMYFVNKQGLWRLRVSKRIYNSMEAVRHIWSVESVDVLIKILMPVMLILLYFKFLIVFSKNKILKFL